MSSPSPTVRGRALAVAVLAALASLPMATATAATPASDWTLITLRAGQEGAKEPEVRMRADISRLTDKPLAMGVGLRSPGGAFVDVFDLSDGGLVVNTSRSAGSVHLRATPSGGGGVAGAFSLGLPDLKPRELAAVLVFVANGTFSKLSVRHDSDKGSVSVSTTRGAGSKAFFAADANDEGLAADAAIAASGMSRYAINPHAGVVGGITSWCNACHTTWHSPDGRSGEALAFAVDTLAGGFGQGSGETAFAGPAGRWGFAWEGLSYRFDPGPTLIAAYAPIGRSWRLFAMA